MVKQHRLDPECGGEVLYIDESPYFCMSDSLPARWKRMRARQIEIVLLLSQSARYLSNRFSIF